MPNSLSPTTLTILLTLGCLGVFLGFINHSLKVKETAQTLTVDATDGDEMLNAAPIANGPDTAGHNTTGDSTQNETVSGGTTAGPERVPADATRSVSDTVSMSAWESMSAWDPSRQTQTSGAVDEILARGEPIRSADAGAQETPPANSVPERRQRIQDEMRNRIAAIRDCYELILELEPALSDRLIFEFEVAVNEDWEADTTLLAIESGQTSIEHLDCFAQAMDTLQMPAPEDGSSSYLIRFPIVLSP